MNTVLVVGAGAAGIMAAVAAAEAGAKVELFEKNDIVGKKMGITGKGRCNITNAAPIGDFISYTPGNGKFLFSAYRQFSNEDLLEKLHGWGLETKVERGGRVFPRSDSAVEVRKLLYFKLRDIGAGIRFKESVTSVYTDGRRWFVRTGKGRYEGDAVIITTGGMSYPATGSTGDGYAFARSQGHTVTDLKASLVPFTSPDKWVHELSGVSLKNVEAALWKGKKKIGSRFGEMLFTHFGVSGPIILMLSTAAAHNRKAEFPMELSINLKPALSEEKLVHRLERDFEIYGRRQMEKAMKDVLPRRLIPVVLAQANVLPDLPACRLSGAGRLQIAQTLQNLRLTVSGTRPVAEAVVTAGGVKVAEITPQTMESKLVPGLYFAGEVIDIDAFTGGYNLQAAFSTGYVAGRAAAVKEMRDG